MDVNINCFNRKAMWALINLSLKNIELPRRQARVLLKILYFCAVSFNLPSHLCKERKPPMISDPSSKESRLTADRRQGPLWTHRLGVTVIITITLHDDTFLKETKNFSLAWHDDACL